MSVEAGIPQYNLYDNDPYNNHTTEKQKKWKKYCAFGYGMWIFITVISVLSLYLDYKCEGHHIVPQKFFYNPASDSNNDDINDAMIVSDRVLKNISQSQHNKKIQKHNINDDNYQCNIDADCNNGVCTTQEYINGTVYGSTCICNTDFITVGNDICNYHQLIGLTALLISIFVGGCGVDRCFMSRGNGCWICMGIVKGFTIGGLGIWWLIDVILIGTGQLGDGNGEPLSGL
jgi:hypothetical protein